MHRTALHTWQVRSEKPLQPLYGRTKSSTADLPAPPAAFHEFQRRLEHLEVLLVIGSVRAVDLDPFPGGAKTARLKRDHVVPGELQLGRGRRGQAKSDVVAADAGVH